MELPVPNHWSDSFPRSTSVSLKAGVDGDGLGEQQLVWDHQQPHPRHKTNKVLVRGPSRCVNHVHILWDSSLHSLGRVRTFYLFLFLLILDLILSAALSGLKLFQQSAAWMGPSWRRTTGSGINDCCTDYLLALRGPARSQDGVTRWGNTVAARR